MSISKHERAVAESATLLKHDVGTRYSNFVIGMIFYFF
jgi:hypothetical protein